MIPHIIDRIKELQNEGLTVPFIYATLAVEGHACKDVDAAFRGLGL